MKRIFSTIILGSLLFINTSVAAPAANPAVTPATLKLAGETWKLGFHEENLKYDTAEYVTENQTVQNWLEMFTYQKFKTPYPDGTPLVNFADQQIAELKKRKYDLIYTIHSSSADDAIIEFQIKMPLDQQQDEIQRLVKGNHEFYILHYVTKKMDMGDAERTRWITILKGLDIKTLQKS